MDQILALNLKSQRAYRARYSRHFNKKGLVSLIVFAGWIALVGGVLAVIFGYPAGYFLLIIPAICYMLWAWHKGSLKNVPVSPGTLDGLLSKEVLARLSSDQPSSLEVWLALHDSPARFFFQNRYLLGNDIFENLLNKNPGTGSEVWQHALQLQKKYNTAGITDSVLLVSLLQSIGNIEQILRRAELEMKDIESGIVWFEHLQEKVELASQRKYFGGLARDWAFGYAPLLQYLGHNISKEIQSYGFFADTHRHQLLVEQMAQGMATGNSTITLVGDIGVGKTTCVYAFAERLLNDKSLASKIRYSQVVSLDAPSLLAQAKNPGELESLIMRLLAEAHKAKNMILFFDNAQVFFGTGPGSVDISNVLAPVLESGSVRLIFAITPKEWQILSANNSAIASHLQSIQMQPANEADTLTVLQDQVISVEYQRKVVFTYSALREAYRLGSRYIDTQVMPGAALEVLKSATPLAKDGLVTPQIIQQSIELSVGVKLQHAKGDESQKLLHLEDELRKYVISQKRAVSVVSDALRRSRSGVGNPNRPVGTFLFLGPTGVGKTELSKALARVYFGNEQSIIRVDMNQYLQPSDAQRLITPMLGDQLGFLGQVRKAPFSVVLLDEIEKAHPSVVNLLLQMLDEGMMSDSENKQVSFKDAIVIATSNAGAERIRQIIDSGEDLLKKEADFVSSLINDGSFAPEFVNRFDEVVLFSPLTQDELVQVIDLIITDMNKTLDSKKVRVLLSDNAKRWLVEKGYDSKLGARPMRRMVQRYVENIIAKKLLGQSTVSGGEVHLDIVDFEQLDSAQ